MYVQVEKSKDNIRRAVANSVVQKKSNGTQGFGFVDNRPNAVEQRKLQVIANKVLNVKRTSQLQAHANHNTDRQQAIQRAIEADRAGAYNGFTLGGAQPTLYFAKGRLTQVHPKPNNVGWHDEDPRTKNEKYNINQEGRGVLKTARDVKGDDRRVGLEAVMRRIVDGEFAPKDKDPASQLVEISWTKGFFGGRKNLKSYHPSRSSMQEPNILYDNNYAMKQLENGNEAMNNKRWVLAGCWPCRDYVNLND